ncbi:uncharacterized protein KZ484_002564 isoform 2-T2 [Pholidichthys leucotaenia]
MMEVEVALEGKDSDICTAMDPSQGGSACAETNDDAPVRHTQHRSVIWRHFVRLESPNAARCRICMKDLIKCGGTGNLHRHLSKKHPKEYSELFPNRQRPKPLNSSQDSNVNTETDDTCWAIEERAPVEEELEDMDSDIICTVLDPLQGDPTHAEKSDNTPVKHKRRSVIWRYFVQLDRPNVARCRLCRKKLSITGGTSNLYRHMSKRHPKEYSKLPANGQHRQPFNSSQDSNVNSKTETCGATEESAPDEVALKNSTTAAAVSETGMNSSQETAHRASPDQIRPAAEGVHTSVTHTGRNMIWKYFKHLEGLNAAQCFICMKKLQCGTNGTTNLYRHMSKRHPKTFSELLPLNSSQCSDANGETGEAFLVMKQRQAPDMSKFLSVPERERHVLKRERELIEALMRSQKQEAQALEYQRELLEKLRAASAREAAAEREQIEVLRKAQQEEAKDLSRQREELQKEKAELQKKWEALALL